MKESETSTIRFTGGRSKLASRDFTTASQQFAKAKSTLESAAENPAFIDSAARISEHAAWLAT